MTPPVLQLVLVASGASKHKSLWPRFTTAFMQTVEATISTASFKSPFWPWTLLGQARSWPSRARRLQQGTEEFPDKFPTLAEKLAHNAAAGVSTLVQELALQHSLFISFDLLLISVPYAELMMKDSHHAMTRHIKTAYRKIWRFALDICLCFLFVVQKLSVSLQSIFHLQPAHVPTSWPRVSNGQSFGWGS